MKPWQFIYGSFNAEDFDIYISDKVSIEDINEKVEETPIEGRNGSLTEHKGYYEERKVDFPILLLNREEDVNIENRYTFIKNLILDDVDNRLLFMNKCYLVDYIEFGSREIEDNLSTKFNITFHCYPFAVDYYENVITEPIGNLNLVGNVATSPIIECTCNGEGYIKANGQTFYITTNRSINLLIDSYNMEIQNVDNKEEVIKHSGYWITLEPGLNKIEHSSNITNLKIRYRNNYR